MSRHMPMMPWSFPGLREPIMGRVIKFPIRWKLTKTGSDFADSYVAVENAVQEYSWKKSVEELNDILRNHFGATAGENISLEARLTATVTERDEKTGVYHCFQCYSL